MNFEKAFEAMKQGKKVYRTSWKNTEMESIYFSKDILFTMSSADVFADDWEIYEEPQKEPQTKKNHVVYSIFLAMNQYGGEFSENQLKKEMRQALSRKFFKLEEEDYDVNADYELDNLNTVISNMLNIYQFLFPEGENK